MLCGITFPLHFSLAFHPAIVRAVFDIHSRGREYLSTIRTGAITPPLTTPMINEFIEKIMVHAPDRSDGDRVQEVVVIHLCPAVRAEYQPSQRICLAQRINAAGCSPQFLNKFRRP